MRIPEIIPLPQNRVWRTYPGGKTLDGLAGISPQKDSFYPEDWIASTTKAVNNGREYLSFEGYSMVLIDDIHYFLKDLIKVYPEKMVGLQHFEKYGSNTQFLLKLLDSSIRLHIQAHPTISFSRRHLNSNNGKTEAYVILNTREEVHEPYIYLGFQKEINKTEFKNAIEQQSIDAITPYLNKIVVKPGNVFIVPGGFPHAIGEGVFMIEIMEPTDFVARLEFERGGYVLPYDSRFMGRDVDFAIEMINFNPIPSEVIKANYFIAPRLIYETDRNKIYSVIDEKVTPCFAIDRLNVSARLSYKSTSFYIGIVSKGKGMVKGKNYAYEIQYGDKFFVPYDTEEVEFITENELEIICALPPA